MDKGDGILVIQLPALVNHFLAATLHFRVVTLHRGKIQIFRAGTGGHGRSRAPTKTNQHGGATQHD